MKYFAIAILAGLLVSCNTLIGVGRDVKAGYNWTADKVSAMNSGGGGGGYSGGAPIY